MLHREQCERKTLVTITGKTSMDKGTQRDVNSVNSLNPPTCVRVRVCARCKCVCTDTQKAI